MKTIFAAIIIYFFCYCPAFGSGFTESPKHQTKAEKNLENAAREFQTALSKKDFEKLLSLMILPGSDTSGKSPSRVEKREKEIAIVRQLFEDSLESGMSFEIELGQPERIENINGELFSVISQYTTVKVTEGKNSDSTSDSNIAAGEYKGKSYYIAISKDKGRNWKFWDGLQADSFKEKFPEASKQIRFPEIQKPAFLNKND